jgi:hypothetical protein
LDFNAFCEYSAEVLVPTTRDMDSLSQGKKPGDGERLDAV